MLQSDVVSANKKINLKLVPCFQLYKEYEMGE